MNDSFLEDLDLVPKDSNTKNNCQQPNNRYITTRKVLSPPTNIQTKIDTDSKPELKQEKIISSSAPIIPKIIKNDRRSGSQEPKRRSGTETKPLSSTPKSDRKSSQSDSNVMKQVTDNQVKTNELKVKPQDVKATIKTQDNNKPVKNNQRIKNSGNCNRHSDSSSKENTRPSTDTSSSRESCIQADSRKETSLKKKSDILEKTDPVMLLNAIKELVSRYTEQETVKVLRAMQNLHINSQANLIKQIMMQTTDIVKELNVNKTPNSVKSLIEENERMREDIFILRAQNEVLRKKIEEMSLIKEENITLKLKLKELQPTESQPSESQQ